MIQATETNAPDTDGQKAAPGTDEDGLALIRTVADRGFTQNFHAVLAKLLENAVEGSVICTRLLVDLSQKAGQESGIPNKPPSISLADAWLAEPEWGESSEEQAETAAGSREPES